MSPGGWAYDNVYDYRYGRGRPGGLVCRAGRPTAICVGKVHLERRQARRGLHPRGFRWRYGTPAELPAAGRRLRCRRGWYGQWSSHWARSPNGHADRHIVRTTRTYHPPCLRTGWLGAGPRCRVTCWGGAGSPPGLPITSAPTTRCTPHGGLQHPHRVIPEGCASWTAHPRDLPLVGEAGSVVSGRNQKTLNMARRLTAVVPAAVDGVSPAANGSRLVVAGEITERGRRGGDAWLSRAKTAQKPVRQHPGPVRCGDKSAQRGSGARRRGRMVPTRRCPRTVRVVVPSSGKPLTIRRRWRCARLGQAERSVPPLPGQSSGDLHRFLAFGSG